MYIGIGDYSPGRLPASDKCYKVVVTPSALRHKVDISDVHVITIKCLKIVGKE